MYIHKQYMKDIKKNLQIYRLVPFQKIQLRKGCFIFMNEIILLECAIRF